MSILDPSCDGVALAFFQFRGQQRFQITQIPMGAWMTALEARAPRNVLIVATANKLARIAWAVLSTGEDYRGVPASMAT